ncbi:MarR family winged helix-turn-helix transcriptional regulator [Actinoplanes subtropicus]|uniref:MarR family winged helix-turn-helix transcriptional regulator n=1 Tax=Actinoplanes subtropicus TaxID=543632 RepID=UPI00068CA0D5|nr:MarR family transcriptional regulator [Actinoplanes subtropicus]
MPKQSVPATAELLAGAARAAADFGAAADTVDQAAAATLGVNRTDLRIIGLIKDAGSMAATALSEAAGLSPGATTTAIQRLVAAGHLHRAIDPQDRRRVILTVVTATGDLLDRIYGPIGKAGERLLARYSARELRLITEFMHAGRRLQLEEAERIRSIRS